MTLMYAGSRSLKGPRQGNTELSLSQNSSDDDDGKPKENSVVEVKVDEKNKGQNSRAEQ